MTQSLRELAAEIEQINIRLGWRDDTLPFGDYIGLLHTEASEATEAFRDHGLADATRFTCGQHALTLQECPEHGPAKPVGVGNELADMVIRLVDTCTIFGIRLFEMDLALADVAPLKLDTWGLDDTFVTHITWLHRRIDRFWDDRNAAGVLRAIVGVAEKYGFDLTAEVARKVRYNASREYQHGGRTLGDKNARLAGADG